MPLHRHRPAHGVLDGPASSLVRSALGACIHLAIKPTFTQTDQFFIFLIPHSSSFPIPPSILLGITNQSHNMSNLEHTK